MNLIDAFGIYNILRDNIIEKQGMKGGVAYKIFKFMKNIDTERELLKEGMDKQWVASHGKKFEEADEELQKTMQEEYGQEAYKITVPVERFLTESDIDQLGLTFNEIANLNLIIME